jgi:V/A-type H+/Na+-transporting ATPase subunit C
LRLIAEHAYAAARLHSIEGRMLNKEILDRLAESDTADDAYKILSERGYFVDQQCFYDHDLILRNEMKKVFGYINEMIKQKEYFMIFFLKKDYHNIKVLLKAERFPSDHLKLLEDGGVYTKETISEYIRDRKYAGFSDIMRNAIEDVVRSTARSNDPQMIDIILDSAYFDECRKNAVDLDLRFLEEHVAISIDLTNLKSYVRIRKNGLGKDLLSKVLIAGGRIETKIFLDSIGSQHEKVLSGTPFPAYGRAAAAGAESITGDDAVPAFEKEIDNHIIEHIKPYKYKVFGIEPVLSHIIAKEYEVKNVRIILSGVINKIKPEIIKERLRTTYV